MKIVRRHEMFVSDRHQTMHVCLLLSCIQAIISQLTKPQKSFHRRIKLSCNRLCSACQHSKV